VTLLFRWFCDTIREEGGDPVDPLVPVTGEEFSILPVVIVLAAAVVLLLCSLFLRKK
jgi:hypothetical protein